MELLLKYGADIDAVNTAGLTPSDVTEWDGLEQQDAKCGISSGCYWHKRAGDFRCDITERSSQLNRLGRHPFGSGRR